MSLKVVGRRKVKFADLNKNLFVRHALNEDRVLFFMELIQNGAKIPAFQITNDNVVVDGRHRIEAYELCDQVEGLAEVVEAASETDLIAAAYQANIGGALPPSSADTEHTVGLLLDHKASNAQIADAIKLPLPVARKFVNDVKSKRTRAKLAKAAAAVSEGNMTIVRAAEEHEVDVDKLKEFMKLAGGKKSKSNVADIQRRLTAQSRSEGQRFASMMRGLFDKLEEGDVHAKQVREIINHGKSLLKKRQRAMVDWEARLAAKVGSNAA